MTTRVRISLSMMVITHAIYGKTTQGILRQIECVPPNNETRSPVVTANPCFLWFSSVVANAKQEK